MRPTPRYRAAAIAVEHPVANADPAERPGLLRTGGSAGRAHCFGPAASDSERLEHAFRVCLGRWPEPAKAVLQDLLAAARQQSPRAPDRDWLLVARALLNLDEFITRE